MSNPVAGPAQDRGPRGVFRAAALLLRIALGGRDARPRLGQEFLYLTQGDTFEPLRRTFLASPEGARLALRGRDSMSVLRDRAALAACPPGSLGRCYADFLSAQGLDESYYTRMPLPGPSETEEDGERRWFRARIEYGHDLRHVIAGYMADELGEVCLLSFRFGQVGHRGALSLALFGVLSNLRHWRAVFEAFQRGRRSRIVDLLAWEDRLATPLAAVRAELRLAPSRHCPTPYAPGAYGAADLARVAV